MGICQPQNVQQINELFLMVNDHVTLHPRRLSVRQRNIGITKFSVRLFLPKSSSSSSTGIFSSVDDRFSSEIRTRTTEITFIRSTAQY